MDDRRIEHFKTSAQNTLKLLEVGFHDLYQEIIESPGYPFNYQYWVQKITDELTEHRPLFDFVNAHQTQDPMTFYVGFCLDLTDPSQLILGINLNTYSALLEAFNTPDAVSALVENQSPFDIALKSAARLKALCAPIGDICLACVYRVGMNQVINNDRSLAKEYCLQALEALRSFYLFNRHKVSEALKTYNGLLSKDIHEMRDNLFASGLLTQDELDTQKRDWGLQDHDSPSPSSRILMTA